MPLPRKNQIVTVPGRASGFFDRDAVLTVAVRAVSKANDEFSAVVPGGSVQWFGSSEWTAVAL